MQKLANYIKRYRVKSDFCKKAGITRQRLNFWINEGHEVEIQAVAGKEMIRIVSSKTGKTLFIAEE